MRIVSFALRRVKVKLNGDSVRQRFGRGSVRWPDGSAFSLMMTRFFCFVFLAGCATSTTPEVQTPAPTPVQFRAPAAAPALPHRTATAAEAGAVFEQLRAVLPAQDAYDIGSLSCTWVELPDGDWSSCQIDDVRVEDRAKAVKLGDAVRLAGAELDLGNKMPSVVVRNVHASRDSLSFDDAANAKRPLAPNTRLEGRAMEEVMSAIANAGVKEDDGTLFIVCNRFEGKPACGYQMHNQPSPPLDAARSARLWNVFVHEPNKTVLNASRFTYDGKALSFYRVIDDATPPPSPPSP